MLPVWPFLRDRAHSSSSIKPLRSRGRLFRFSFRRLRMRVSIARARLLFLAKMDERLHHPHAVPRATGCSLIAIHLHVHGTELTFRQRTERHGHLRWQGATRVSQRPGRELAGGRVRQSSGRRRPQLWPRDGRTADGNLFGRTHVAPGDLPGCTPGLMFKLPPTRHAPSPRGPPVWTSATLNRRAV